MGDLNPHQQEYKSRGVAVLENACPAEVALSARERFEAADYDHITQARKNYFRQSTPRGLALPGEHEIYSADFWRARFLETTPFLQELCARHIAPLVHATTGVALKEFELRAYKMERGGHFRLHIDDYIGEVGFVWYLCREWKWDWGGLLITVDGDKVIATVPKFNQLAIINHGVRRLPHLVSEVAPHALEPRYMLVGFGKPQAAASS